MTPETQIETLRAICMKLPRAAEKVSHGMPTFFIDKGKTFCWFLRNAHNPGIETAVAVKADAEEQEMLIDLDPDLYFRPAYLAPRGWIGMRTDQGAIDWDHIADRVETSWERIAPKRLLEQRQA